MLQPDEAEVMWMSAGSKNTQGLLPFPTWEPHWRWKLQCRVERTQVPLIPFGLLILSMVIATLTCWLPQRWQLRAEQAWSLSPQMLLQLFSCSRRFYSLGHSRLQPHTPEKGKSAEPCECNRIVYYLSHALSLLNARKSIIQQILLFTHGCNHHPNFILGKCQVPKKPASIKQSSSFSPQLPSSGWPWSFLL